MADIKLNSPLQYIKGVGPRRAEVLARYGMREVRDLLFYFPRHYLDRTSVVPIAKLKQDQSATIIGTVRAHGVLHGKRRRYEVILEDDTGAISLIWFQGVRYWERIFEKNQIYAATGTVSYFMGHQMIHPDLERLEEDTDRMIHAGRIIPVYPQTSELNKVGLNSKGMRRLTTFVFENLSEHLPDYLPPAERHSVGLFGLNDAIRKVHYPEHRDEIERSRRRLAYDELLEFQYLVFRNMSHKDTTVKSHSYEKPAKRLSEFLDSLPFRLTDGQKEVSREIFTDLRAQHPMSRLLQGDVGCGKTVVAILAALYAAENGLQSAFMAPTEILAEQHYRVWKKALSDAGVRVGLLTSSLKSADKKKTAGLCEKGEIDLLFGTHALIYDYVSFRNLGLVIIDEQHRFGVEQRGKLYDKGDNPDLLVMTATPIPRTLALTLYGDLDISTIKDMPAGRKPIRTVWRAKDARDKVYKFVLDDVDRGGQTYIVYPLIEKSDQMNLESVEDACKELSRGALKSCRVGMVHGRIKAAERDKILQQFREGELDVLLATTVIEVGLDNPNATTMIVEHAERFGLAQLHQLRGRIGRGEKQATLIAIAHPPVSEIGHQRLKYFVSTTDGFKIAEADLELRGPGEIFGIRQSGLPELRIARLVQDQDLIEASRGLLIKLFKPYSELDVDYQTLYKYLEKRASRRDIQLGGG
ncbi:MAG: ATP-dependent DNA helicase RecG [Candidatus Zixiibacteriota bacterium]|nr:MAG: ATP-dependent DNA helicase RecG [candidate division Zixibacteria bacterium]